MKKRNFNGDDYSLKQQQQENLTTSVNGGGGGNTDEEYANFNSLKIRQHTDLPYDKRKFDSKYPYAYISGIYSGSDTHNNESIDEDAISTLNTSNYYDCNNNRHSRNTTNRKYESVINPMENSYYQNIGLIGTDTINETTSSGSSSSGDDNISDYKDQTIINLRKPTATLTSTAL